LQKVDDDKRKAKEMKKAREQHPKPVTEWCRCAQWRKCYDQLQNYQKMNFCIFCGKKLNK